MRRTEFTIKSYDPPLLFTGEFGDAAPMPTDDSYGGWVINEVPKRMNLTTFGSRNPVGLAIDFIVDRLNSNDSDHVLHQFKQLERLAGRNDEDEDPPLVFVNGGGQIPHDLVHNPHTRWFIETLTWDREAAIYSTDQRLLRIAGSIQLRQWSEDETLGDYRGPANKNRKKHRKSKAKSKGRSKTHGGEGYTVKTGDTLISIASRELGDSKRWREIADLNNIRNPRGLKVGRRLRMPK
jgi:LysM repeat protein